MNNNRNDNSLLKCKRNTLVSTFNVRTLTSLSQVSELAASAAKWNIDIICIQEHRFYHEDMDLTPQIVKRVDIHISFGLEKFHEFNNWWCWDATKSSGYVIIEQYRENPSKDDDCHFQR